MNNWRKHLTLVNCVQPDVEGIENLCTSEYSHMYRWLNVACKKLTRVAEDDLGSLIEDLDGMGSDQSTLRGNISQSIQKLNDVTHLLETLKRELDK